MSKALRCDRCSTCFDPYTVTGEWATIKTLIFQNSKEYEKREVGYRDEDIHFCPKCAEQFAKWLNIKEEKKDEKVSPESSDNFLDWDINELFSRMFGGGK